MFSIVGEYTSFIILSIVDLDIPDLAESCRRAFERHPGFDDKDPDWFLEELGAKKAEHPLMPVLCCMQQAFFLYEKAMNKLMKLAGLRPLRGFYG